jgi:hypothetical protein
MRDRNLKTAKIGVKQEVRDQKSDGRGQKSVKDGLSRVKIVK